MSKFNLSSFLPSESSHVPGKYERLALSAAQTSQLYREQLSELSALAKTLQADLALRHGTTAIQSDAVRLLSRLADEYESDAKIWSEMYGELASNAAQRTRAAARRKRSSSPGPLKTPGQTDAE
jgi:hypothetical protein